MNWMWLWCDKAAVLTMRALGLAEVSCHETARRSRITCGLLQAARSASAELLFKEIGDTHIFKTGGKHSNKADDVIVPPDASPPNNARLRE